MSLNLESVSTMHAVRERYQIYLRQYGKLQIANTMLSIELKKSEARIMYLEEAMANKATICYCISTCSSLASKGISYSSKFSRT